MTKATAAYEAIQSRLMEKWRMEPLPAVMHSHAKEDKKINKNAGGANAFFIRNMFKNLEKI